MTGPARPPAAEMPGRAPAAGAGAAQGVRRPWSDVPAALREAVEQRLGGRVVAAVSQPGGFSPGVAARLRLDSGARAFVKAIGPEPNPDSPGIHRAEARIAAALPPRTPAPRLLGSFESGGWVVLLFEEVDGVMPAQPWQRGELNRVLGAMASLAADLDPAPVEAPAVADRCAHIQGWRRLADPGYPGGLAGLDPWALRNLASLAELEAGFPAAAAGTALAHTDIRADNILLTQDSVVFVDWPWACIAAPWFDLLTMLPSVLAGGGPPPEEIFAAHPTAQGADPAAVTVTLAALAGFFVRMSRQAPPPGLPTLRPFQAALAEAALAWLQVRTGWL
jgi:aminoglycoside phosphotransferase (APT) family kinase protein